MNNHLSLADDIMEGYVDEESEDEGKLDEQQPEHQSPAEG